MENNQVRDTLSTALRMEGYSILEAESGTRALDLLQRQTDIALILTALDLSDMKGVNFVTRLYAVNAHISIIVLVESEKEKRLAMALQSGADDFLLVPPSPLRLKLTVETYLRQRDFKHEAYRVRRYAEDHLKFKDLVAKSPKTQYTISQAKKYIRHEANILLCGEKGCEHELIARIIHRENTVRHGTFVHIPCLPCRLDNWQATLAVKLAQAQYGSLLLANIDRLDMASQQHLVEQIRRVSEGSDTNVRFMATTELDLANLVRQGNFNSELEELFAEHIEIPSLRERPQDIEELCHVILKVVIAETGCQHISGIGERALSLLQNYDWPGNLAELENALFRAVLLSDGPVLSTQDFPQIWRQQRLRGMISELKREDLLSDRGGQVLWDEFGHIRPLNEIERYAIDAALQRYGGHSSEAARRLNISRATLYRKMEAYKMNDKI